jgi:hypothetical protein
VTTTLSHRGYGVCEAPTHTPFGFSIVQILDLCLVDSCPPACLHTYSTSSWRSLFPAVPAYTLTQRPPGGVSFLRTLSSPGFLLCNLCTRSMPFWQSFSESSAILVPPNSQQSSFLCAPLHTRSMPSWQSSYRTYSKVLSATVSQLHSLAA